MSIVTTYVCDVTGRSGHDRKDFIDIRIQSTDHVQTSSFRSNVIDKLVHRDVANKLHLLREVIEPENNPEPTFGSKLETLIREYVNELAYEAGSEGASEYISNRGY